MDANGQNAKLLDDGYANWREELTREQIDFVFARISSKSIAEACRIADVDRGVYYRWENKKRLEDIVKYLLVNERQAALETLRRATPRSAVVKVEGLDSEDEKIRQGAATEILDRIVGRPAQPVSSSVDVGIIVRVGIDTERV